LYVSDDYRKLLRIYGLLKVHKEGNPLRLIVSYIKSFHLATYLKDIEKNIEKNFDYIKNSFELVKNSTVCQ